MNKQSNIASAVSAIPCAAVPAVGRGPLASPEPYGPPTSHRMDAAGGPFNDFDCKIAKARARGDEKAARELQQARADINIKLMQQLEPVWVPTESQLAIGMMLRVAGEQGICTLPVDEPVGWERAERSAYGMPGTARSNP